MHLFDSSWKLILGVGEAQFLHPSSNMPFFTQLADNSQQSQNTQHENLHKNMLETSKKYG